MNPHNSNQSPQFLVYPQPHFSNNFFPSTPSPNYAKIQNAHSPIIEKGVHTFRLQFFNTKKMPKYFKNIKTKIKQVKHFGIQKNLLWVKRCYNTWQYMYLCRLRQKIIVKSLQSIFHLYCEKNMWI